VNEQTEKLFPGRYFISTVLETLDTKSRMSGELLRAYLQRAAMAGVIIGLFYATNYAVIATFHEVDLGSGTLAPLGHITGAVAFGFALVFIYYTKSELLTSNMMIVSIGAYYQRIGWVKAMRLLTFCYLGNLIGGVFIAVLLRFSTIIDGAVFEKMLHSVHVKQNYITDGVTGWVDLLIRAILCNFMINLAMLLVYNGLIKEDITKVVVMIASVFIFAFLGFEHSVANTVLFCIVAMQESVAPGPAVGNVAIALIGNFVGGGLLIGIYYAYVNDNARHWRKGPGEDGE
jgi:formate/nitrite transporter FocA (FNT family)